MSVECLATKGTSVSHPLPNLRDHLEVVRTIPLYEFTAAVVAYTASIQSAFLCRVGGQELWLVNSFMAGRVCAL